MQDRFGLFRLIRFFHLDTELEPFDVIHEDIKKGIIFKGTNLWILMFAIIIASVGLNMNSTAVIIGAMLISPLMGPINGMGYSIATYDLSLFRKSLTNYSFAVIASLAASTFYFALSPVSTAHSELLARTSPTIYDVIIALFGGFAGIVAISSRLKGNVIPGVAIATALMPPLCTAGYGLATGQFEFFFGAFYLFTINTIFIAIAAVWVSQLLKFPISTIVEERRKRRINSLIYLVITIVLLPSIYFGYNLIQREQFRLNATKYISNISFFEGNYLLDHRIDDKRGKIHLIYGGHALSEAQKINIVRKAGDFSLKDPEVIIEQGLTFSGLDEKGDELFVLKTQIGTLSSELIFATNQLDSIAQRQSMGGNLLNEISALFPQIKGCSFADARMFHDTLPEPRNIQVVFISATERISDAEQAKIKSWLMKRMNSQHIRVFYE
jgi:uncharacterized hydrophobic protein (TIGR00271 family)